MAEVRELSRSNLALKRLIKRNAKREAKASQLTGTFDKFSPTVTSDSVVISKGANKEHLKDVRCRLPFVVADYSPDTSIKGKLPGMRHHGKFVNVVSKRPIRVFEDRDCLNQLSLSDDEESDSESSGEIRRENHSVSRTFYKKPYEASIK